MAMRDGLGGLGGDGLMVGQGDPTGLFNLNDSMKCLQKAETAKNLFVKCSQTKKDKFCGKCPLDLGSGSRMMLLGCRQGSTGSSPPQ